MSTKSPPPAAADDRDHGAHQTARLPVSRRQFISSLAALGVAAAIPLRPADETEISQYRRRPRRRRSPHRDRTGRRRGGRRRLR